MAEPSQRVRELQQQLARREQRAQGGLEPTLDCLVFFLGEERFALRLREVEEVVRVPAITLIPGVHPAVLGAVARHGEVLPILDLRRLLGFQEAPHNPESRVVVARHEDIRAGLLVDRVEDIVTIPERLLRPAVPGGETVPSFLLALAGDGAAMLRILDLAALLETVRHGT